MTAGQIETAWFHFAAGGEELAVPGSVVREVAFAADMAADARAPAMALGVLALHGGRVPVLDLASCLQLGTDASGWPYVVVVRAAGRWVGLPATAVHGLVPLSRDGMRPLPASAHIRGGTEILGAYPFEEGWLMLLDVDQLVRGAGG